MCPSRAVWTLPRLSLVHHDSRFGASEGAITMQTASHTPTTPRVTSSSDRLDPAVRRRLSGPGLRAFFTITERWGVTAKGQRILLAHLRHVALQMCLVSYS